MNTLLKHYPSFHLYLAGPIDYLTDRGVGIRSEIKNELLKIGIEEQMILDPTDKPVYSEEHIDFDAEKDAFYTLRKEGKWAELEEAVKMTMHVDLRFVDKSDVIIAYLVPNVPMFGTIHEIVEARRQKKPVLMIDPRGIEGTSIWAIGLVGHENIFSNTKDAVSYLDSVLKKKQKVDHTEWLFLHLTKPKKKHG